MPRDINQIATVLNLFLDYYMTGLACFFSPSIPLPSSEELAEIIAAPYKSDDLGVRIDGGSGVMFAQTLVECIEPVQYLILQYGGLSKWRETFMLYKEQQPERAHVLEDLSQVGGMRYNTMEYVADKHHTSVRNLWNIRKIAVVQIATEIYRRGRVLVEQEVINL